MILVILASRILVLAILVFVALISRLTSLVLAALVLTGLIFAGLIFSALIDRLIILIFITRLFRISLITIVRSRGVFRLRFISIWIFWTTGASCFARLICPENNTLYFNRTFIIIKLNSNGILT